MANTTATTAMDVRTPNAQTRFVRAAGETPASLAPFAGETPEPLERVEAGQAAGETPALLVRLRRSQAGFGDAEDCLGTKAAGKPPAPLVRAAGEPLALVRAAGEPPALLD